MVKITFLGGCREVGRSAVLLESEKGNKVILDYGVRFRGEERLPIGFDENGVKAVALTHCHVDHSGGLPYLYKKLNVPFLTNPVTLALSEILIRDMIKISKFPYPFGYKELNNLVQNTYFLNNQVKKKITDDISITFFNAGHVPGSVSILVEIDGKNIFYTGDLNTIETYLIKSASVNGEIPPIDALIIESTYALRDHPLRDELERHFIEKVVDINENNGKVLIPAFGVARSQEALLILTKYGYTGNIYIDGMAGRISKLLMDYPESLKEHDLYKKAIKSSRIIFKRKERSLVKKSKGVIIAPSGMLKGGPAIHYIKSILREPNSGIFLVGYQVEGTPGRELMDNRIFEFKDPYSSAPPTLLEAECQVEYFDFSSHMDHSRLHEYINNIEFNNGSKHVFCVHGESKATTTFAGELVEKNFNAIAPETGESYKL